MQPTKIIVTGGAGFIGSHLVDYLVKKKYKVLVIDNLSGGDRHNLNPKAIFKKLDIEDKERINRCFRNFKPEYVVHLAGIISKSSADAKKIKQVNYKGTLNILNTCVKEKVKKFVFASSAAVYGKAKKIPVCESQKISALNPYAASKINAEKAIFEFSKKHGLNFSILRYANVYGPRQRSDAEGGVVSIFCKNIYLDKPIKVFGNGTQSRDFIFINDVTRANFLAIFSRLCFTANISTNKETHILELIKIIEKESQKKARIISKPKKADEIIRSRLDNSLIRRMLKWQPKVDLKLGIAKTLADLK